MLFQELLDVEKLVFLKPYPNIQILKYSEFNFRLLFMSDVEKEEMKWLKSCMNSQN